MAAVVNDPAAAAVANEVAKAATQHMVRILRERGTQYQIEWSQPESNPERSWESKRKIDTRAEYKDMVLEWRARQEVAEVAGNPEPDEVDAEVDEEQEVDEDEEVDDDAEVGEGQEMDEEEEVDDDAEDEDAEHETDMED